MAVTLKDIAKLANIDTGAVSRTLRNHPEAQRLRPETRQRIIDIANKLGYKRNTLASAVRTGFLETIAVIGEFDHRTLPFYVAQVISGILSESTLHNYGVKIYSDNDLPDAFAEINSSMIKRVISMSPEYPKREETALLSEQYGMRLVFAHEYSVRNFPAVNVDNFLAAKQAVSHLIQAGHKRIGLLCAPHHFYYQTQRHNGYLQALADAELEVDQDIIFCSDEIEKSLDKMFSLPEKKRPTAIFGLADDLALRTQIYAIKHGLKLPDDLSIFGFGNFEFCNVLLPLSTIDEQLSTCGEIMVKVLLEKPCGIVADKNNNYLIKPVLISRDSVKQIKMKGL